MKKKDNAMFIPKTNYFMKYEEMIKFLLKKYGPVNGDYFLTESCKSKNTKISRGKEHLYIHHIYENRGIMLSNPKYAIKHPFEYQKAKNLVYCDLYEHLQLHMILTLSEQKPDIQNEVLGLGGVVDLIVPELIDHFAGWDYKKQPWRTEENKYLEKYRDCFMYEYSMFVMDILYTKKKHLINYFKSICEQNGNRKIPRAYFLRSLSIRWCGPTGVPETFVDNVLNIFNDISVMVQAQIREMQKKKIKECPYLDIESWCVSKKF